MASNRGLNDQEILDRLFADDQEKDAVPNIGVDTQSDAEEAETEYEEDSEEDEADYEDPLQYLSSGLAPVMQPVQNVGLLPDNQVAGSSKDSTVPRLSDLPSLSPQTAGSVPRLSDLPPRSPQAAGSSTGITSSPAPGWHPDIPSMPSELRTSPYPSRRSEQRDPTTDTNFEQHLESLNSPLDIPFDVTTPSAQSQPADIAPSSQARLTSVPKVRSRRVPAAGHQNQYTLRLARLAAANSAKRPRVAPASGSGSSDDMFPPSPVPQTFRLRSLYGNPSMPEQMEVSDPDDPQPLPPSPTVQNTGRVRFRSLIDNLPCDSGDSGSEYQPNASDLSNSASDSAREGLPDSPAVARSPSIPPALGSGGRRGRAPGRPSLQHRRRGRGRGAQTVPAQAQSASAPTPAVPTLAPAAPPGPRRHRARPNRNAGILYEKSYKRARGPQREAGDPIRLLLNQTILGSDKQTV